MMNTIKLYGDSEFVFSAYPTSTFHNVVIRDIVKLFQIQRFTGFKAIQWMLSDQRKFIVLVKIRMFH